MPQAAASDDRRLYLQATFSVKNQDILNDDALHFKLARSVLKIASFEFANLKQRIVHLVAYIYMLTSNEEISKIEKTYL